MKYNDFAMRVAALITGDKTAASTLLPALRPIRVGEKTSVVKANRRSLPDAARRVAFCEQSIHFGYRASFCKSGANISQAEAAYLGFNPIQLMTGTL